MQFECYAVCESRADGGCEDLNRRLGEFDHIDGFEIWVSDIDFCGYFFCGVVGNVSINSSADYSPVSASFGS